MNIKFKKKNFLFKFLTSINNSKNSFKFKKGWIVKLQLSNINIGFGEISPLNKDHIDICKQQLNQIPENISKNNLLKKINNFHPCVQSGINSALAELEGVISYNYKYSFNEINQSAILVNSETILDELEKLQRLNISPKNHLTIKWKVAIKDNKTEEKILEEILSQKGINIRLRIDSNGSWSRECAHRWAEILKNEIILDWLEQPLPVDDIEGLIELNKKIPVALDESLIKYPKLIHSWKGWQIRRPSQESDPLRLIEQLDNNKGFISLSTSFETGVGRRLLFHLSNIQLQGLTPKVPGLALRQMPKTFLFENNPKLIWDRL
tara:strand:- start:1804 stop:2769 length:966 start_codon:yes stop_codon:yes gene_type:complete